LTGRTTISPSARKPTRPTGTVASNSRRPGSFGSRSAAGSRGAQDDLIEQIQGITVGEFYAMAAGGQIIFT
jgi:hypothetical protein